MPEVLPQQDSCSYGKAGCTKRLADLSHLRQYPVLALIGANRRMLHPVAMVFKMSAKCRPRLDEVLSLKELSASQ